MTKFRNIPTDSYISLSSGEEIRRAAEPLFQNSMINYFAYMRYYKTGEIVEMCTNSDFIYQQHAYDCGVMPSDLSRVINSYNNKGYISSFYTKHIPLPPALQNRDRHLKNIAISDNLAINNRYYILKDCGEYIELVGFASSKANFSIESYINNKLLLEQFTLYFKMKMLPLINQLKNKSKEDKFLAGYDSSSVLRHDGFCSQSLLDKIKLDHIVIDDNFLTPQESRVLIYYANGYTAKNIARILSISHRTVESHIYKIKTKFDYASKEQLLKKLERNGISISTLDIL
jgi:DNA-binding CsgD family transcriptional regulator